MSLILEALRKSEAERRRGQAPGLFVEQVRRPVRRRDRAPAWAWALILLLAGVLLAWGWREFGGRTPASVENAAGGSPADGSAASRPITQSMPPAPGSPQHSDRPDASPNAAPRAMDAANEADAATGADAYGRAGAPADENGRGSAATPARAAQIVATTSRETPGTAPTAAAIGGPGTAPASRRTANSEPTAAPAPPGVAHSEPGETAANAGTVQNPSGGPLAGPVPSPTPADESPAPDDEILPRLSELTGDERSLLPALKLSMHVYADDPAQRFVIVDGRRLREGDSPAAGIAVEAIRRDGLVLSVNGRRVLLARP